MMSINFSNFTRHKETLKAVKKKWMDVTIMWLFPMSLILDVTARIGECVQLYVTVFMISIFPIFV